MNVWGSTAPLRTQLRHGTQGIHILAAKIRKKISIFTASKGEKNVQSNLEYTEEALACVVEDTHVFPDQCAFKARNDSSVLSNERKNKINRWW